MALPKTATGVGKADASESAALHPPVGHKLWWV